MTENAVDRLAAWMKEDGRRCIDFIPPGSFASEWMADLYPETDVQITGALSRDEAINMALDLWEARVSKENNQ